MWWKVRQTQLSLQRVAEDPGVSTRHWNTVSNSGLGRSNRPVGSRIDRIVGCTIKDNSTLTTDSHPRHLQTLARFASQARSRYQARYLAQYTASRSQTIGFGACLCFVQPCYFLSCRLDTVVTETTLHYVTQVTDYLSQNFN